MTTKNKLIMAGGAVALVVLVLLLWPKDSPLGKQAPPASTICTACGAESTVTLKSVPDTCAQCGARQVYPSVKCPKCNTANALDPGTGPQARQLFVRCRNCDHSFAPGATH